MESFARRRRAASIPMSAWEIRESQRTRLLSAMAAEACERGVQAATVARVIARAGISRATFYEMYADREDCLLSAIEQSLALAAQRAHAGVDRRAPWAVRVRAGLHALLALFDEQPTLPRLCLLESRSAGPAALARRAEALDRLAEVVDGGRALARRAPPPLTAEGVVGGAVSVICSRLLAPEPGGLTRLLGPLMSSIVLPYLGAQAARAELRRPLPLGPATPRERAQDAMRSPGVRLTRRTVTVLDAIATDPGLTNAQLAARAGIRHASQTSRLLSRLADLQLIETTKAGVHRSAPNAWRLTRRGEVAMRAIRYERLPLPAAGFTAPRWRAA